MHAQVLTQAGWSGWYLLGSRAGADYRSPARQEDLRALVDVDTLKLSEPATAFRYRFSISAGRARRPVILAWPRSRSPRAGPTRPNRIPIGSLGPRTRAEGALPARGAGTVPPRHLQSHLPVDGHGVLGKKILDRLRGRRGPRPGHRHVRRLARERGRGRRQRWKAPSPGSPRSRIWSGDRGRPPRGDELTFGPGELSGSPLKKTKGHLVVVAGFDRKGDLIVQDPAAPDRKSTRRVYDRAEFHRAWMVKKRGLAYLLWPAAKRQMTVGLPETDLLAKPRQTRRPKLDDDNHLSQLLYGKPSPSWKPGETGPGWWPRNSSTNSTTEMAGLSGLGPGRGP